MERETIVRWFEEHPRALHGNLDEVIDHCERSVRRHAREDAWLAAKRYASKRRHDWEEDVGAHASEAYVAREICGQLARELQEHEPHPGLGDEDHLAGGPVKAAVERDGWEFLIPWIMDMARHQEHETWLEIVRFTRRRARELIRSHHLSDDCSFDHSRCYGEIAARVTGLLEHEYSTHAFPR